MIIIPNLWNRNSSSLWKVVNHNNSSRHNNSKISRQFQVSNRIR